MMSSGPFHPALGQFQQPDGIANADQVPRHQNRVMDVAGFAERVEGVGGLFILPKLRKRRCARHCEPVGIAGR